jgi:nitrite reductase/ring-hydroxylating ferredoxin subunit
MLERLAGLDGFVFSPRAWEDVLDRAVHPAAPATPELETFGAEAYASDTYARAEPKKLWRKVWQHAFRVEEVPEVGGYVVYDILDDTIIVRSGPDEISAFHNVCAHHGKRPAKGCGHARSSAAPITGMRRACRCARAMPLRLCRLR